MLASSWQLVAASLISAPLVAQLPPVAADSGVTHAARVEALRAKAKEQIQQDRQLYSESQIQDLEARYQSAHQDAFPMLLRRDAGPILVDLIAAYPKSNRSGCAVLKLARLASGKEERERYLKEGIATHSGAWCESGVQVGALARALLAVQYAGSGKLDEAERLAKELLTLFPGAIDESGAPLDDVLEGIRLLRGRDPPEVAAVVPEVAQRLLAEFDRRFGVVLIPARARSKPQSAFANRQSVNLQSKICSLHWRDSARNAESGSSLRPSARIGGRKCPPSSS